MSAKSKKPQGLGIKGVSLHSYRYAWAERAKQCGYAYTVHYTDTLTSSNQWNDLTSTNGEGSLTTVTASDPTPNSLGKLANIDAGMLAWLWRLLSNRLVSAVRKLQ